MRLHRNASTLAAVLLWREPQRPRRPPVLPTLPQALTRSRPQATRYSSRITPPGSSDWTLIGIGVSGAHHAGRRDGRELTRPPPHRPPRRTSPRQPLLTRPRQTPTAAGP
jgi:hypothetical protein